MSMTSLTKVFSGMLYEITIDNPLLEDVLSEQQIKVLADEMREIGRLQVSTFRLGD